MTSCCEDKGCEISALRERHARVLYVVLAINALMFIVEGTAGWLSHSTSLLADALDMLGDALVYGFSLFVLSRSSRWQASAAAVKGPFMLAFGVGVLAEAAYKIANPVMPNVVAMGYVGAAALLANFACFALLYRHRSDNLNMRSTWLCSRNDLVANIGVLVAAAGSYFLASRWPDILVGVTIAGLFLASAVSVLRDATRALRAPPAPQPVSRPIRVTIDTRVR